MSELLESAQSPFRLSSKMYTMLVLVILIVAGLVYTSIHNERAMIAERERAAAASQMAGGFTPLSEPTPTPRSASLRNAQATVQPTPKPVFGTDQRARMIKAGVDPDGLVSSISIK
jgi:hypothetical protein